MSDANVPAPAPAPAPKKLGNLDPGVLSNLVLIAVVAALAYLVYSSKNAATPPPVAPAVAPEPNLLDLLKQLESAKKKGCPGGNCPNNGCPNCPNNGNLGDAQANQFEHLPAPAQVCPGPGCPQNCRCSCRYCPCGCQRRGDLAPAPAQPPAVSPNARPPVTPKAALSQ